jgi:hypothetical protein
MIQKQRTKLASDLGLRYGAIALGRSCSRQPTRLIKRRPQRRKRPVWKTCYAFVVVTYQIALLSLSASDPSKIASVSNADT